MNRDFLLGLENGSNHTPVPLTRGCWIARFRYAIRNAASAKVSNRIAEIPAWSGCASAEAMQNE
jgi:hypothetical protein